MWCPLCPWLQACSRLFILTLEVHGLKSYSLWVFLCRVDLLQKPQTSESYRTPGPWAFAPEADNTQDVSFPFPPNQTGKTGEILLASPLAKFSQAGSSCTIMHLLPFKGKMGR